MVKIIVFIQRFQQQSLFVIQRFSHFRSLLEAPGSAETLRADGTLSTWATSGPSWKLLEALGECRNIVRTRHLSNVGRFGHILEALGEGSNTRAPGVHFHEINAFFTERELTGLQFQRS